jgi:hypothetical protein
LVAEDEPVAADPVVEEPDDGAMPAQDLAPVLEERDGGAMPAQAHLPNVDAQAFDRYPTHARRSVWDHNPYSRFLPQVQFLQSATCESQLLRIAQSRARRSVVRNNGDGAEQEGYLNLTHNSLQDSKYESDLDLSESPMDNVTQESDDPKINSSSEDELAMCGYLLTQYNLKAGLREFGERG